jgi:hypothetical protein
MVQQVQLGTRQHQVDGRHQLAPPARRAQALANHTA